MPIYRLRRVSDNKTFDEDARDDAHAVMVFGQLLSVALTLEGPAAPQYMMGRIEKDLGWAKPEDIPVYEDRQN